MIWLTWRQHRRQLLFAIVGLAVIAALMVPTGRQMHETLTSSGLADCVRAHERIADIPVGDPGFRDCHALAEAFASRYGSMAPLAVLFVFLPLLVGLFFGAPLVAREVEQGTHRLVWTQGVSRTRWAVAKFGLVGAGALALAVAYAALLTWWIGPVAKVITSRLTPLVFDEQGLVPVAYTLFAVALGVFAGTVWRKVLPAMAVTLVGFIGVRLAMTLLARPRFMPARTRTYPLTTDTVPNDLNGDWIMANGVHRADGRLVADNSQVICGGPPPTPAPGAPPAVDSCGDVYGAGAYNQEVFHPADRFWAFQYIEAGVYVVLAAVLLLIAAHHVRRRIS